MIGRRFLGRLVSFAAGRQQKIKTTVGSVRQFGDSNQADSSAKNEQSGSRINNERPEFPGSRSQFTTDLKFVDPNSYDPIPVFRVLDTGGNLVAQEYSNAIDLELAKRFQKGLHRKLSKHF